MDIRAQLTQDMKDAMKAKDSLKLDAIRFLQSAIKYKEVELRPNAITQDDVMGVIKKLVKQRKESIEQYTTGGRQDLADKESQELKVLEAYLPAQMNSEQIEKIVGEVIADLKATSIKDMGAVMKAVSAKTQGTADNKLVSEIIKKRLS